MVRVIERSPEKVAVRERQSRLVKITKEVCGWRNSVHDTGNAIGIVPYIRAVFFYVFSNNNHSTW